MTTDSGGADSMSCAKRHNPVFMLLHEKNGVTHDIIVRVKLSLYLQFDKLFRDVADFINVVDRNLKKNSYNINRFEEKLQTLL